MWRNPKYATETKEAEPPPDQGELLTTFPRGRDAELRVSLAEFEGRPYIALRVFERGSEGRFYPARGKGCSVRIGEAGQLAEVLARVASDQDSRGRGESPRPALQEPARRTPAPRAERRTPPADERSEAKPEPSGVSPPWDDRPQFIDKRPKRRESGPIELPPAGGRVDFDECEGN